MDPRKLILELRHLIKLISTQQADISQVTTLAEEHASSSKLIADALLNITFNVHSFPSLAPFPDPRGVRPSSLSLFSPPRSPSL